jgi:tRNA(Ile)-lysidine synthase
MKLAVPIPHKCYLAFSGGSDSSMLLHFMLHPKRDLTLLHVIYPDYINYKEELLFVTAVATKYNLPLVTYLATVTPKGKSKEHHWSNERNSLFQSLSAPVCTAHTLDDALEWFLLTATKGAMVGKYMSHTNGNVLRPLLLTTSKEVYSYIDNHSINCYTDNTNYDLTTPRNNIRHNILPNLLQVNPGIYQTFTTNLINHNCC